MSFRTSAAVATAVGAAGLAFVPVATATPDGNQIVINEVYSNGPGCPARISTTSSSCTTRATTRSFSAA